MDEGLYSRAGYYDIIYQNKDYDGETEFVVEKLEESEAESGEVLVLGCGTGEHSRRLTDRGFEVTGLDANPEMLEKAKEKSDASFEKTELPDINAEGEFGLVLVPFGVINYLDTDQLTTFFENIRKVLSEDGVLIFDNGDYDVEGEESDTMLEVFPDEDVGRIGKTRRVEGRKMLFEAMIMTEEGCFADTHELWAHTNSRLQEELENTGFRYKTYEDGYGTESGKDHGTVFVAEMI